MKPGIRKSLLLTWKELVASYTCYNVESISKVTVHRQCFRNYERLTKIQNQVKQNLEQASTTLSENYETRKWYAESKIKKAALRNVLPTTVFTFIEE